MSKPARDGHNGITPPPKRHQAGAGSPLQPEAPPAESDSGWSPVSSVGSTATTDTEWDRQLYAIFDTPPPKPLGSKTERELLALAWTPPSVKCPSAKAAAAASGGKGPATQQPGPVTQDPDAVAPARPSLSS